MSQAVDQEIRELRARFWSQRDPEGRAFAPLADAYRRKGDLDEALSLVEDGLARLPDFTSGQLVAARVFRSVDDAESARRALDRLLELDPRNTLGLLERAEVVGALGDRDAAAHDLQTLLALEPGHLGARSLLDRLEAPPEPEPAGQGDVPESEPTTEEATPFVDLESGWEEFAHHPTDLGGGDAASGTSDPLGIGEGPAHPALDEASELEEDSGEDHGLLDMGDFDPEEFPTAHPDESSFVSGDQGPAEIGEEESEDEFGLDAFTADIQPGGWDAYEIGQEDAATVPPDVTGELEELSPEASPAIEPDSLVPSPDDPGEWAEDDDLPYVDLPYVDGTEVEDDTDEEPVLIDEEPTLEAPLEEASSEVTEASSEVAEPEAMEAPPADSGPEVLPWEAEAPADIVLPEEYEAEPEPASTAGMDWEVDVVPDSPQLMTRTMAEIYVQQGLTARSVKVYESLVDRNPSDEGLRQRLEELRLRLAEEEAAEPSLDESAPQWVTSSVDEEERATPFAWDPDEAEEDSGSTDGPAEAEEVSTEEVGRPIGRLFDDLLSWEPGAVPIGHLAPGAAPELAPAESALARALASGAPLPGREPERKKPSPEPAPPPSAQDGSTSTAGQAGSSSSGASDADRSDDPDDMDDFRSWLKSLDP